MESARRKILLPGLKVQAAQPWIGFANELQHRVRRFPVQRSASIFPVVGYFELRNDVAAIDPFVHHVQADAERHAIDNRPKIIMLAPAVGQKTG